MAQSARKAMLEQELDPNIFDTRTHFFDNQGRLVKKNLYTLYVINGEQFFERPVNSGNLWSPNNQPSGRIGRDAAGNKIVNRDAAHIAFTPARTADEALHFELENQRFTNEQLREQLAAAQREIDQIKADRASPTKQRPNEPAPVTAAKPKLRAED